jgi:hypothetical protein
MAKDKEEKTLTIHDKWNEDSKLPNGGLNFDDSEWDGTYIKIRRPDEKKED